MLPGTYIVFDLETTGLDPEKDRIIEIGAVKLEGGEIVAEMSSLVYLDLPLPPAITRLTGIEPEMLATAPPLAKVLDLFLDFAGQHRLVSHNTDFDTAFLNKALGQKLPNPLLDTLELTRILWPCLSSYNLDSLSTELSLTPHNRHRALADAQTAAALLKALWERTLKLPFSLLTRLNNLSPIRESSLATWFQAAAEINREQVWKITDEVAAGTAGAQLRFNQPEIAQDQPIPFEPAKVAALLEPEGLLASCYPDYEYRPQQVEILLAVAQAFNEGSCLAIEAGTGSGKSLAYLLPAIFWAKATGKRVAIATHTINLQEQLWRKDIPELHTVLPFSFRAALLKGRSHYLCQRKLRQWLEALPVLPETARRFAMRLMVWLHETETGDWSEMKFWPQEEQWRQYLAATSETCQGEKCPWYSEGCFLMRSRRQAENAQILVLNHSLLMEDAKYQNQLLPPYPYLIIDEAHHIEEVASEHLGSSCSSREITLLQGAAGENGVIRQIDSLTKRLNKEEGLKIKQELAKIRQANTQLLDALQSLTLTVQQILQEQPAQRLAPPLTETSLWEEFLAAAGNLEFSLDKLQSVLPNLVSTMESIGARSLAQELEGIRQQAVELRKTFSYILDAESDETVSWLETTPKGEWVLRSAPIEVGPLLAEVVYAKKEAVILTSATLTVGGEFAYFRQRSGLDRLPPERVFFLRKPSPFNYNQQVFLGVVTNLPNPGNLSDADYAAALAPAVEKIIAHWGGHTLILFTSHRLLQATYELISDPLRLRGCTVLAQGIDGSRSQILTEFQRYHRAVLLGASSFWEGVDLPGDLLNCVLIPRLPFPAPNQPLIAARLEYLAAQGLDPFLNLSLPQASIRLAQGFGRLIRRAGDRGAVIVLDKRLVGQRYGKYLLDTLPIHNVQATRLEDLILKLTSWQKHQGLN